MKKEKPVKGVRAMENQMKVKLIYLTGYQAAIKSMIEKLQEREAEVSAEIKRCKGEED